MGAVILVLGLAALVKRSWRRGAMHAAVIVGLVGFVATVGGLYDLGKKLLEDGPLLAESTMAVLCGVFVILLVKSFLAARFGRQPSAPRWPSEAAVAAGPAVPAAVVCRFRRPAQPALQPMFVPP